MNLKLELMNLLLLMPAMIERSQALNRMIYLRFSNVNSTHPIEEDIGIKILTAKVSVYNMASVASYIYFPKVPKGTRYKNVTKSIKKYTKVQ